MFTAFRKGVEVYALSNTIHSNSGKENAELQRYLLEQHNNIPSHVIVGSSTNNELIEHSWRDLH